MYTHVPVLLNEVIEYLKPESNKNFVDCTLGGGGHALKILEKIAPKGKVLGIDLDERAIESIKSEVCKAKSRKSKVKSLDRNLILVKDNFVNLKNIIEENNFYPVNGILIDLGISSAEYEESGKGFSFQKDEFLDMRFGTAPIPSLVKRGTCELTAYKIVNKWTKDKMIKIFKEYGEEKVASKIVNKIISERKIKNIESSKELADLVFGEYIKAYKNKPFKKHPATKVFQALRIAVNDELGNLEKVLPQAVELLEKGGRLAIISFHSLEDRIVKRYFVRESKDCLCPADFPVCRCGHKAKIKIITKKIITASQTEINDNPRARSAKLRVVKKI